jgi:hypothetical protein
VGLSDDILVLDDSACCPAGHRVARLQTKDLEPSMSTYLLTRGALVHAVPEDRERSDGWRLEDGVAVREERYRTEVVSGPRTVRAYGHCDRCAPILIRTDGRGLFGLVDEREPVVDFDVVLRPGEPAQLVRTSGTRDEQVKDMLARGLFVLREDEPLAIAHREATGARDRLEALGHRPRDRWR